MADRVPGALSGHGGSALAGPPSDLAPRPHRSEDGRDCRCLSCGEAFEGNPRFCPNCAAPQRPLEPRRTISDSFAATALPSPRARANPWSLIIPLIAAGLVIILLAGWLVSGNGHLNHTRTALAAEQARVTNLNGQVSSLTSQVKDLTAENNDLQTQNSSLNSAMIDCKDAASKIGTVLVVVDRIFQGTASYYDFQSSVATAERSMSVCRAEAATNGSF